MTKMMMNDDDDDDNGDGGGDGDTDLFVFLNHRTDTSSVRCIRHPQGKSTIPPLLSSGKHDHCGGATCGPSA